MEKKLSTGRKVVLNEMTYDDMDVCKDIQKFGTMTDGSTVVYNFHKSMTTWIRKGLSGGDFKQKINGSVPDSVLKELTDVEKLELVELIKNYNILGE